MKILLITVLSIISFYSSSQAFYNSFGTDDFTDLINNGLVYVKSGHKNDAYYEEALEKYWNSCPYRIVDPKEEDPIYENDMILVTANEMFIARASLLQGSGLNKYKTVGYIMDRGFGLSTAPEANIRTSIAFLNSCVKKIQENQIKGKSGQVNDRLEKVFMNSDDYDKSKTFLIVGETENYISIPRATKAGLKCKTMDPQEFAGLDEYDREKYYLLYTDARDFFTFAVFDLGSNELVFTHRDSSTAARKVKIGLLKKWMN